MRSAAASWAGRRDDSNQYGTMSPGSSIVMATPAQIQPRWHRYARASARGPRSARIWTSFSSRTDPSAVTGIRARPARSSLDESSITALVRASAQPADAAAVIATTIATASPNVVNTTNPLLAATSRADTHTQPEGASRSANRGTSEGTYPGCHGPNRPTHVRVTAMTIPAVPPGTVDVQLRLLDDGVMVPAYAHPGDAGADLVTRLEVILAPGERATVPTGVAIALPDGYAAFVHPRSGLAARNGLTLVNAPGTVDAGYRGEIWVTLLNTDRTSSVTLRPGDRIAQLVIQRVERARFLITSELPGSVRGVGGHGSTGGFVSTSTTPTIGQDVGAHAPEGERP